MSDQARSVPSLQTSQNTSTRRRLAAPRELWLNLRLRLRLLHIRHGILAPILLQACAIWRLRCYRGVRVHALGSGRLLHLRRLALPAGEELDQFLIQLDHFRRSGGYRHDGGTGLYGLARLVVLLGVLSEVGEVGLEPAHVA
jgi:hypothetical protein